MLRIQSTPPPTRGEILRRAKAMPAMRHFHKVGWQVLSVLRGAFAQQTAPRAESKGVPSEGKTILNPCNERCTEWAVKTSGYSEGIKRCGSCEKFLRCDKLFCPCCSTKLRVRPLPSRARAYIRTQKEKLEKHGITKTCIKCGKSFRATDHRRIRCMDCVVYHKRKRH